MPADAAGRSFAEQLRDEHNISQETAERGIAEYRRFLYLSALGEGRNVPSRAVDAVWHLHLTHTRDYWERFVPDVLGGTPIHHQPGSPEGHRADYARTIDRYEAEFGEAPPKGIWRQTRFLPLQVLGILALTLIFGIAGLGSDAPIFGAWPLLIGGYMLWRTLSEAYPDARFAIEIDIWSDREGGDCGDCGGCGD
ncbi:MAG: hypothetical protein AAGF30_07560 [Pseudomonadota bacterium]